MSCGSIWSILSSKFLRLLPRTRNGIKLKRLIFKASATPRRFFRFLARFSLAFCLNWRHRCGTGGVSLRLQSVWRSIRQRIEEKPTCYKAIHVCAKTLQHWPSYDPLPQGARSSCRLRGLDNCTCQAACSSHVMEAILLAPAF